MTEIEIQKNSEHWYEKYKKQQEINKELVDENQELQDQNRNLQVMLKAEREVRCNEEYLKRVCELEEQIEQAKKIIKNLMVFAEIDLREYEEEYKEAEQFLKEIEK